MTLLRECHKSTLHYGIISPNIGRKKRICISYLQLCLVNVRRFFAQRYSPFDMGDFCVLAPTRRTRVRLRVAVLHKSPHLKRFRPATGRINAAVGIFDIVRLAVSSLFARLGISLRLLSRRSSPIRVALLRRSP